VLALAGGAGSAFGTGGMATKLTAAKIATGNGIDMIITNGSEPENLYKILDGETVGTLFKKAKTREE
ncbi:MAG: glutamate 5-kinase, partial [Clostridiales bacterium]|nr:glutamate 5-kinase [Clostridiales bacterium]